MRHRGLKHRWSVLSLALSFALLLSGTRCSWGAVATTPSVLIAEAYVALMNQGQVFRTDHTRSYLTSPCVPVWTQLRTSTVVYVHPVDFIVDSIRLTWTCHLSPFRIAAPHPARRRTTMMVERSHLGDNQTRMFYTEILGSVLD